MAFDRMGIIDDESAMMAWIILVGVSMVIGVMTAWFRRGKLHAGRIAGAIAWLMMLAYLLIAEYVLPYRGGGASMWPIALLLGGTVAALVAAFTCLAVRALWR